MKNRLNLDGFEKFLKKFLIDDQVKKFYIMNVSHEGRTGSKTRCLVAFLLRERYGKQKRLF